MPIASCLRVAGATVMGCCRVHSGVRWISGAKTRASHRAHLAGGGLALGPGAQHGKGLCVGGAERVRCAGYGVGAAQFVQHAGALRMQRDPVDICHHQGPGAALGRRIIGQHRQQVRVEILQRLLIQRQHQLCLGREVVVQAAVARLRAHAHLLHGGGVVALRKEEIGGGVEQRVAGGRCRHGLEYCSGVLLQSSAETQRPGT
jgi:hypothetical protein